MVGKKKVSKPTCKCLKALGFFTIMFIILEITQKKSTILKAYQFPIAPPDTTESQVDTCMSEGEGWFTDFPMFSRKPGSALDPLKHESLSPYFQTKTGI